ncbi:pyruvate formate-lyase-activating protein [Paenibacillus beijingensis]|uniref:Pyruvate formate-lyase-activating enzyme n=1 Tax=Paenibacillus beijingensis TaxID=1126833 RepID=A0A0D5NK59_9BACL|nr:pyruvate formate-lyase-activating protein [Paenibacillus beijingensis]AJY75397.1 pyruvate formate lyase-activating protein [Paenibacillus beijingensis]
MKGRIHSIETFGTVDGPGIRFVLFMQGCALRCAYCHNPDTWDTGEGKLVDVDEILSEIEPYVPYYRTSGGGITVTGGEPTLQAPFVAALFMACKERWGLHTALDSSGFCEPEHAEELIAATDLVLLDLKHTDRTKHTVLTSQPNDRILRFARWLAERKQPVWIRHVLVPGLTDHYTDLIALGQLIGEFSNVEKFELLPYHRMGVYKWQQLGRAYPLEGVREPSAEQIKRAHALIERGRLSSQTVEI